MHGCVILSFFTAALVAVACSGGGTDGSALGPGSMGPGVDAGSPALPDAATGSTVNSLAGTLSTRPVVPTEGPTGVTGRGQAGGICPAGVVYGHPLAEPAVGFPALGSVISTTAWLIQGGFESVDGPVWVEAEKMLLFSDIVGNGNAGRIQKYSPADGKIEVWADMVGTNGLAIDSQGKVVAASQDVQRLTRFDPVTKVRTQIAGSEGYMGKPFNAVKDVVVRADGNIYFTDPTYQQGGRPGQDVSGFSAGFYRLSPAGKVTRIAMITQPNGIAISPDGKWLYVSTAGEMNLRRFALAEDGAVDSTEIHVARLYSRGMGMDCAGNLYLTTSDNGTPAVRVISTSGGSTLGWILGFGTRTTPGPIPSNVAFGGEGHKTLFITVGTSLYQIRLSVPGFPN